MRAQILIEPHDTLPLAIQSKALSIYCHSLKFRKQLSIALRALPSQIQTLLDDELLHLLHTHLHMLNKHLALHHPTILPRPRQLHIVAMRHGRNGIVSPLTNLQYLFNGPALDAVFPH